MLTSLAAGTSSTSSSFSSTFSRFAPFCWWTFSDRLGWFPFTSRLLFSFSEILVSSISCSAFCDRLGWFPFKRWFWFSFSDIFMISSTSCSAFCDRFGWFSVLYLKLVSTSFSSFSEGRIWSSLTFAYDASSLTAIKCVI